MTIVDITELSRRQLMKFFEKERQEWLALGLSEAVIFNIHFGDENENGRGGDYRMWLDERKYHRPDHKYCRGTPISLSDVVYEGSWFEDHFALVSIESVIQEIDIESILSTLTEKQADLIRAIVFDDKSCAEYARENGLNKSTVSRNLDRAREAIKLLYM